MNRLIKVAAFAIVALLLMFSFASAQEDEGTADAEGFAGLSEGSNISVAASTPVTATLQLQIDGRVVNVVVPGLLTIDAQAALDADALAAGTVMPGKRIGGLTWEIESILNAGSEIEAKYGDPLQSETGEFVIVTAKATNIGQVQYDMTWNVDVNAIDKDGITYEKHDRGFGVVQSCDSVNPGLTVRCQYLFEVPTGTEIVGLDVGAKEYGTVYAPPEE